jgi:hypothetical protein
MTSEARIMNTSMAILLAMEQVRRNEIPGDLRHVLSLGVIEKHGCVLLRALENTAGDFDPRAHFDRTGYECLVNHVHIDPRDFDDPNPLRGGLAYAQSLVDTLKRGPYQGPFRTILSMNLAQNICTVRFHRIRHGETWISDDLESYLDEGILAIDADGPTLGHL